MYPNNEVSFLNNGVVDLEIARTVVKENLIDKQFDIHSVANWLRTHLDRVRKKLSEVTFNPYGCVLYIYDYSLLIHYPDGFGAKFKVEIIPVESVPVNAFRLSIGQELSTYGGPIFLRQKDSKVELVVPIIHYWINSKLELEFKKADKYVASIDILNRKIRYFGDFEGLIKKTGAYGWMPFRRCTYELRLRRENREQDWLKYEAKYEKMVNFVAIMYEPCSNWHEVTHDDRVNMLKHMSEEYPKFAKLAKKLKIEEFSKNGLEPFLFVLYLYVHYAHVQHLLDSDLGATVLMYYFNKMNSHDGFVIERFEHYFPNGNNLYEVLGIAESDVPSFKELETNTKKFCSAWMAYRRKAIPNHIKTNFVYDNESQQRFEMC